jgi:hypothetical protein
MGLFKMIVKTEDPHTGRMHAEHSKWMTADQLATAREYVRQNTPRGSVRPIRVVSYQG